MWSRLIYVLGRSSSRQRRSPQEPAQQRRYHPQLERLEDRLVLTLLSPTLLEPIGGSSILNSVPTFSWDKVSGADKYAIMLTDTTGGGTPVTGNIHGTSWTPSAPLTLGDTYQWEVQALTKAGSAGPLSTATFTEVSPFASLIPPNGGYTGNTPFGALSFGVSSAGTINVDIPGEVTAYGAVDRFGDVTIVGSAPSPANGLPASFSAWGTLDISTTGSVQTASVSGPAQGSQAGTIQSGTWTVSNQTFIYAPLDTPDPVTPSGLGVSVKPTFSWAAVRNANFYTINVDDLTLQKNAVLLQTDIRATSWTPTTPLIAGHNYQWEIQAYTGNTDAEASPWSAPQHFSCRQNLETIAPTGNIDNLDPTLTWSGGVAPYTVSLEDRATGKTQLAKDVTSTSWTPAAPLALGDTYQWKVTDATHKSSERIFTETTPLVTPQPIAPGSESATPAQIEDVMPTFAWTSVANALSYTISLMDTTTSYTQTANIKATSWTPTQPLTVGDTYQWQVQAINNNLSSPLSSQESFKVISPFAGAYQANAFGQTVTFSVTDTGNVNNVLAPGVISSAQGSVDVFGNIVISGSLTSGAPFSLTGMLLVSSGLGVAVTSGGSGYTTPPTVSFSGGGGSGATAVAIIGGVVTSITITNPGSGYSSPPTVSFSGGGGAGATAVATISPAGVVASITIINPGSGYTTPPTVSFSHGGGLSATAVTTISPPGALAGIAITGGGSGYTTPPTVSFSGGGGSGAAAVATVLYTVTLENGAANVAGTLAPWSVSATLTGSPLNTPTLFSPTPDAPAPAGQGFSSPLIFNWAQAPGATYYKIEVMTASNAVVVPPTFVTTGAFALSTPLLPGDEYIWSLAAFDNEGDASPEASAMFTVALT